MSDEFDTFKKNIKAITSTEFNSAHSLIGKIVGYTDDMRYCDVEVIMKGGKHTFGNVPAHGFPVMGSSAIIHFHDGNIQQPFCDCEYRLNPPDEYIVMDVTKSCYNWHNNGDFMFGTEGYTSQNGTDSIVLHDEGYTSSGKGCVLTDVGSYIEFKVDISECKAKYFKFQCFYRGLDYLKVECYNADTMKVIQNLPETMAHDYKIWTSSFGRFKWAYNKEVYKFVNDDMTLNKHILIRLTCEKGKSGEISTERFSPHGVEVDGLLVYSENGDNKYYHSEQDMLKLHKIIQN